MYAITQMAVERSEPHGAAQPIGNSVAGNLIDAIYEIGTLANTMEIELCRNEIPDFSIAQKYPDIQKWIPAKR